MSLKNGKLLVFKGTNWKLAGDPKWEEHSSYVVNGHEKLLGERVIDGVVQRCSDFAMTISAPNRRRSSTNPEHKILRPQNVAGP